MSDDAELIDRVAAVVDEHPAVARRGGAGPVEVATYLPGRRVVGVRDGYDGLEVHVVLRWTTSVARAVDDLRAHLLRVTSRPITIVVRDLEIPSGDEPSLATTGGVS